MKEISVYEKILFSFLYRDKEYPAIKKSKGYSKKGALKTFIESFKSDIIDFFLGNNDILKNRIWLYAESVNQFRAIEFLTSLENTIVVTNSNKLKLLFPREEIHRIIHKKKIFYRLKWLRRRIFYKKLFKNNYKDHFNTIFKNDGSYESLLNIFNSGSPKAIIMTNDHNAMCRTLLFAGKARGIPTIYLQHAAVTDRFPPLNFDISLLEGIDSLNKYSNAGPIYGKVELVGMPKFDQYIDKINRSNNIDTIGLALNNGDDFDSYFSICNAIRNNIPDLRFICRFHPSINTDDIGFPEYFSLSSTKEENSFDFLSRINLLFAGNSSIHLEATLMNVISAYIGFENVPESDYYGFIENKLVDRIFYSMVIPWINMVRKKKYDVRGRAKYYVDTINTVWDGRSGEKIKHIIEESLLNGNGNE